MTYHHVPTDFSTYAEPPDVRALARTLDKVAERLSVMGDELVACAGVSWSEWAGAASEAFRRAATSSADDAATWARRSTALAVAADGLAGELQALKDGFAEIHRVAAEAGLARAQCGVWPPHASERREDTPERAAKWAAFDRCWAMRDQLEARFDKAEADWERALAGVAAGATRRPERGNAADLYAGTDEDPGRRTDEHKPVTRWVRTHQDGRGDLVPGHWELTDEAKEAIRHERREARRAAEHAEAAGLRADHALRAAYDAQVALEAAVTTGDPAAVAAAQQERDEAFRLAELAGDEEQAALLTAGEEADEVEVLVRNAEQMLARVERGLDATG